jgi:hypothetical protein
MPVGAMESLYLSPHTPAAYKLENIFNKTTFIGIIPSSATLYL